MNRKLLTLGVVAAVVALVYITVWADDGADEADLAVSEPTGRPTDSGISPEEATDDTDDLGGGAVVERPPGLPEAVVVRLADGDSFDITWLDGDGPDEIRLLGINAPEGGACFGDGARDALADLVLDRVVAIEGVERDDFGRLLANVWVEGTFVNGALVESGAALALSGDGPHASEISGAQRAAADAGRGLWSPSECGTTGDSPVRIATIEFDAPGPDNQRPNGEWIEIENGGDEPVDLSGWSIRDESTRNRYHFPPGFSLGGGDRVRVRSGCGDDTTGELFWCAGDPVWTNAGDTGFLVDADGAFVDTFGYTG